MGLLDTRTPTAYTEKLEKFRPLYYAGTKLLAWRKSKVVQGTPQKGARFFAYHLLTQQGVPAGFKLAYVLCVFASPFVTIQAISSYYHPYKKNPLRL